MKFEINLLHSKKQVDGIPIKFKGFEEFDFFLYQADGTYGLEAKQAESGVIEAVKLKGKYLIAEVTTGLRTGETFYDPVQCYDELNKQLNDIGLTKLKEIYTAHKKSLDEISQEMP